RRYAMRAITLAVFDRYPERFGAEGIVPADPIAWDTVMIDGRVRMSLLAEAAGCSLDELNALNPALLANSTPGEGEWPLRIPAGSYDSFVAEYDDVQRAHGASHQEVTLRLGETVESLAERYGLSGRLVRAINDLERRASVPAGTILIIPSRYSATSPASADEPIVIVTSAAQFRLLDRQRIFYQTVAGDSVSSVAAFLDVDRYQLAAWNDLSVSANLPTELWMQIFLPELPDPNSVVFSSEATVRALALGSAEYDAWEAERETVSRQRRRTYTVRRGDTLIAIAQRYDVRVRDLMRWNRLEDAGRIYEGQDLRLTR
ncbi:MAG: membrane-bound lytic murein transglycosylase D, partial [Bradymonadia bacterium]